MESRWVYVVAVALVVGCGFPFEVEGQGAPLVDVVAALNYTYYQLATLPALDTVNNPNNAKQGIIIVVRDLTWDALGALVLGMTNASATAHQFFEIALSSQVTDPLSVNYGMLQGYV